MEDASFVINLFDKEKWQSGKCLPICSRRRHSFTSTLASLNSDVWSENFKCRIIFRPLYTEKFTTANLGFWSILFTNVLKS